MMSMREAIGAISLFTVVNYAASSNEIHAFPIHSTGNINGMLTKKPMWNVQSHRCMSVFSATCLDTWNYHCFKFLTTKGLGKISECEHCLVDQLNIFCSISLHCYCSTARRTKLKEDANK